MGHLPEPGITRRGFLAGAATGLAVGAPLTWLGLRAWDASQPPSFTGRSVEVPRPAHGMPGRFPGRVVEVQHPGAVRADHTLDAGAVKAMVHRGMVELTGADHPVEAWRSFFEPDDVVGIKVNPVGRKPKPGEGRRRSAVGSISSPELLLEVVRGLRAAGVKPGNILVFERYADEFVNAGYAAVMTERVMDGVRWYASAAQYDNRQVDIAGFPAGRSAYSPELARHVVGYDPDVFVHMGFAHPDNDPRDDRRYRSHLSVIATRLVNKIITLPVLKDHRSAGVTLALKNLSHGLNNNVARSHLSGVQRRDGSISGPNQCNTFIPTAVAQEVLRQKATLHILDGLIGVYEGGPGSWNRSWATWPYGALFFATDPVAMDHVGWDILDAKRAAEGWRPVAQMGLLQETSAEALGPRLALLAAAHPAQALPLAAAGDVLAGARSSEVFDRRQPEHIILAGTLGLGVFDARGIEHRRITLPGHLGV